MCEGRRSEEKHAICINMFRLVVAAACVVLLETFFLLNCNLNSIIWQFPIWWEKFNKYNSINNALWIYDLITQRFNRKNVE